MKTGLVVLNYNDAIETIEFVKKISEYNTIDHICVVDNGSNDNSYQKLKKLNKGNIKVLPLPQNKGYSSGNNAGLQYLYQQECELFIVANPDIIIEKDALLDFLAYIEAYPDYAIYGPAIKEGNNLNHGWKLMKIGYDIMDNIVYLNRFFKKRNQYKKSHYNTYISEVDVVSGCFFAMKKEVIDTLGYLDEGTFLYYEENILAKKAKDCGFKSAIINRVEVIHNHAVTIDKNINHYRKLRIMKDSQYYYQTTFYKHMRFSKWLLKKTGDFACYIAAKRTPKKLLTKRNAMKKKVTILSLHMQMGGIEKAICSLANMLVDQYDVEILNVYKIGESIPFSLDDRVQVTYLTSGIKPNREAFTLALKNKKYFKILKEGLYALKVLRQKKKSIKKAAKYNDGDIIVSSTLVFNSYFARYQSHKLLIAWEHCHPDREKKYTKRVIKATKRFDIFIPASHSLYTYYQELITGPKCMYLPLCIDTIPEDKAKLGTNQITVMGRLSKEKGYDDMLLIMQKVVSRNPYAHLHILGDGDQRDILETMVNELSLKNHVTFHGTLVGKQKEEVLLNTSVFVTTSHYESFGLVLLEAMSYGIPCLSFDSAKGSLDIIDNGKNGYIIKNRNLDDMANHIVSLLDQTTKVMPGLAIKKARSFSYDKVKKQWLEAFEEFSKGDLKKRVIFTSSAGGHYSELCELSDLMKRYNSFLLTEDHEMMNAYKKQNKARSWYLRPGTKEHLFRFLRNFPFNIAKSFKVFLMVKPDVIIATGAHTTVPICYIAKIFRKKVIFIETFANITTKTLSGKLVYPIADLFLVQWPEMLELYPKAKYRGGLK